MVLSERSYEWNMNKWTMEGCVKETRHQVGYEDDINEVQQMARTI